MGSQVEGKIEGKWTFAITYITIIEKENLIS